MVIFFRVFIKIFAVLSSISIFLLLIGFLFTLLSNYQGKISHFSTSGDITSENKIALLKLNGPILNGNSKFFFDALNIIYVEEIESLLNKLKKENINGLVVDINSPGGSVSASNRLYNILKEISNDSKIEIFFHTNELIASGAYWAALSGKKIYANYGSLVGSIGVKGPDWLYYDNPISISNGLFGNSIETKNGIKKFNNVAGYSKDIFDPYRKPTNKEINDLQIIVENIYNDFVNLVSQSRKIEKEIIINEIGAMIYDTKSAENHFLIDGTATLSETLDFLAKELKLENYQIIEPTYIRTNFIEELIRSILIKKNFINLESNKYIDDICEIYNFSLSAIMINSKIISEC